jgi:hypothetical protein
MQMFRALPSDIVVSKIDLKNGAVGIVPDDWEKVAVTGHFAEGVLGIFRIIRGFADLRDLAAVSVPYKMEDNDQPYRVVGHQRTESEKHAEDIKKYLKQSENRFLPEVILSLRMPIQLVVARGEIDPDDLGLSEIVYGVKSLLDSVIVLSRRYSSSTTRMQRLRIR